MPKCFRSAGAALVFAVAVAVPVFAQQTAAQPPPSQSAPAAAVALPSDYVIGPEDVLGVVFWREPDISGDVTVRPDGRITIPVIGEIHAAGLRPEALQEQVHAAASKYLTDVNVAIVVREINSRKIFVTGRVNTPGPHPLTGLLTVVQAIALAGGLTEFANDRNITVLRTDSTGTRSFKVNYRDIARGRNLQQNIVLLPGDTIVVP
jgi:polysaccharide export outer membrane protein